MKTNLELLGQMIEVIDPKEDRHSRGRIIGVLYELDNGVKFNVKFYDYGGACRIGLMFRQEFIVVKESEVDNEVIQ